MVRIGSDAADAVISYTVLYTVYLREHAGRDDLNTVELNSNGKSPDDITTMRSSNVNIYLSQPLKHNEKRSDLVKMQRF